MAGMTAVAAYVAEVAISAAISYAISYALAPDGPDTTGARVEDLGVQTSAFGEFIPIVYGQMRLAGNVISMENNQLKETAYKQDRGGKGGPDAGSHTTFMYSGTWDVALCEGPIAGIRRRWADNALIYDAGSAANATTKLFSDQTINKATFYLGDGNNVPDPIVQGYLGVAETPEYTGICHVIDDDFQVGDFGNRVPNMTYEVISAGTSSALNLVVALDKIGGSEGRIIDGLLYRRETVTVGGRSQNRVWRHDLEGNEIDYTDYDIHEFDSGSYVSTEFFPCLNDPRWIVVRRGAINRIGIYYQGLELDNHPTEWENTTGGSQYYCIASGTRPVVTEDFFIVIQGTGGTGYRLANFALNHTKTSFAVSADHSIELDTSGTAYVWADVDNYVYAAYYSNTDSQYHIDKYTQYLAPVDSWTGVPAIEARSAVWDGNWIRSSAGASSPTYLTTLNSDGTYTNVTNIDPPNTDNVVQLSRSLYLTDGGIVSLGDVEPDSVSVGDIVSDLFSRAGLGASVVDVTALTERCYGYAITSFSTLRRNIEPLMSAFMFDMVEEDYVLKCVPRGGSSILTINETELAARIYGEETPQNLVITEKQESELPKRVNVHYLDVYRDYEKGVEFAEREVTTSSNVINVELPIAMQAQQAAELADKLLAEAWIGKYTYRFTLPKKYSYLEPTNVITIELADGDTFEMRLTSIAEGVSGIMECEAVASSSDVYTSYAQTEEGPANTDQITIPGPANIELLDIPILRDADDDPGFYIACGGFLSGYQGSQLYKSNNGGETYVHEQALTKQATMGRTTDVLPDGPVTVFDYDSTVNVRLTSGSLESKTRAEIEAGANMAVIGVDGALEVLKFTTATLEADGTYTLSGFIRGYRGTEQHTAGHAINDEFILLTTATIDRESDASTSEIGQTGYYQVIPYSALPETLANPQQFTFTNNANGLKPFSPVDIQGTRAANDDLTITWTRRTRLNGEWRDYVDVPLGEATESYSIDIMNGATVVRTLTSSTETVDYTAADQTTDFGAPQSSVEVNIYQISETVGRGFPGNATV